MFNGQSIPIDNFAGGLAGNLPATQLALNQAFVLDNVVVKPGGKGLRSRLGNTKFNSSAMNSGANVQGIGYYLQEDGDEWLLSVCGDKVYKSDSLDGTMDDITGSIVITAGADNHWDLVTFNDTLYGFGGPLGTPDAAFKWTGTSDATVLSGNPTTPLQGAITANNRMFGWSGSTVYWSIIGNAEDWTGSGSGSAVIGSLDDNEVITGMVIISTNYMLVFKENSVHQIVISSAPFPVYSLFDTVGSVGHYSVVNVEGTVYFIGTDKRMYSTNGETITEYNDLADNYWDTLQDSRAPYVIGFQQHGSDYDWLVWLTSPVGATNIRAIIFDLKNQCWLQCTKGYEMNVVGFDESRNVYLGGYDGTIYKPDQVGAYFDASEGNSTTGAITAYWKSGWIVPDQINQITQVNKITTVIDYKAVSNLVMYYGFDGTSASINYNIPQARVGSAVYVENTTRTAGRGNSFQFQVYLSSGTVDFSLHKIILAGKTYGQKGQVQD